MVSYTFLMHLYFLAFGIMEKEKTEQSDENGTEEQEAVTEKETVAETTVKPDAEETAITTATDKGVDPNISNYIRLRGLPFSAKEDDVRKFLKGVLFLDFKTFLKKFGILVHA